MAYKHGIYTSEQATSLVPMTETDGDRQWSYCLLWYCAGPSS